MKFQIFFDDENDFEGEYSSLSYGHFELKTNELSVSFFEDKSCMIYLTLANLADFLKSKKEKNQWFYNWIGEGNGRAVSIRRKGKNILFFEKKESTFDFTDFEKAVFISAKDLIKTSIHLNPKITLESAFQNLKQSLE